jgi:hypothetical protein
MAQTKTASSGQRTRASKKSQTRSRARPKSGGSSNGKARTAKPRQARSSSRPKAKSNSSSKPKGLVDKSKIAGETVEETAKDAGRAVGRVAGKAKVPLMAGGAALAGAAGGIALGSRQAHRHRGLGGVTSKDLAKAARKAGNVGAQVGEIALEVRRARETSNGQVHRSPIEVVLQGLTSRRTDG